MDLFSWRAAFWINLPLAALVVLLTLAFMPETRDRSASGRLDWGGTLIAFLACGSLTLGLTWLTESDGRLVLSLTLVCLGLAGLLAFFWFEGQVDQPLAPPVLFRSRAFTGTNLMTLLLYGSLSGTMFLVPIDLIERRGMTPTQVGLAMMPFGLIIGLLSSQAGKLSDRIGSRPMLLTGPVVVSVGVAGLALQLDNFWLGVELPLCIMALGMAIVVSPLTTTVMNSISDARAGSASGINNTASRLAGLFAIAIAGVCAAGLFQVFNRARQGQFGLFPDPGASGYEAIVSAYQLAYAGSLTLLAVSALGAALLAAWLIPKKPGAEPVE